MLVQRRTRRHLHSAKARSRLAAAIYAGMTADPREALLACAADPRGDVATGALWMAREDQPDCEPQRWLELLDELAAELGSRLGDIRDSRAAPVISDLLRDRIRLRGCGGGDPRAHYLNSVLERGAGIPLSCAMVWIAVGRRAGIEIEGVGLPGHFVVRIGEQLLDPFADGEPLDDSDARELVGGVLGHEPAELDPRWTIAATPRSMLTRMSRNLRGVHASMENWALALRAADRCVALDCVAGDVRDRGLLRWRAGQNREALDDLRRYLELCPGAADRKRVEEVIGRLRSFMN